MALIKCPDCSHDVSTRAVACPNCGCPMEPAGAAEGSAATPVPTLATPPTPAASPAPPPAADSLDEAIGEVVRFLTAYFPQPDLSPEAFAVLFRGRTEAGARVLKLLQGPPIAQAPAESVGLLVAELPTEARQALVKDLETIYPSLRSTRGARLDALDALGWFGTPSGTKGDAAPVALATVYRYLDHGPAAAATVKKFVYGAFPHLPTQNAEAVRIAEGRPVVSITQDVVDIVVEALPYRSRRSLLDIAKQQEGWDVRRQIDLTDLGFLNVRGRGGRSAAPEPVRVEEAREPRSLPHVPQLATPATPTPSSKAPLGCLALIAAVAICWLIGKGSGGSGSVGACVACMKFVEARLKAPSTADFPACFSQTTTALGSGEYRISGYVDAQNSFGAMVRTNYTCVVKDNGGENWSLLSLSGL